MNRTVYELLPSIYILIGLIVGLSIDNYIGRWSAALLILAGVVVFNMRILHRTLE